MLRYRWDFRSQDPSGPHDPLQPLLSDTLLYDEARGVLELLPRALEEETRPLPGAAVDVNGEIYRSARRPARIDVTRCDGSEEPLVCEQSVFAAPRGLALDRRGYLFAADARARRVVMILPEDGSVRGILGKGLLVEPVDVAVSPGGDIFAADRGGRDPQGERLPGKIAVFDAGLRFVCAFEPRNAERLPEVPRPIAVMVDEDGSILVADASHPRLLRLTRRGEPLPDVELLSLTRRIEPDEAAWRALEKIRGKRMPQFPRGACRAPRPPRDGGEWLAATHRNLRLLALRLGREFASEGEFLSASLDSGTPGVQWHRIEVEADLPEGAKLTVETASGDDPAVLDPAALQEEDWRSPRDPRGEIIPITPETPEQLVQSPPGRYLRLRVRFSSDGAATPTLRSIRVLYPRVGYLDLLPAVYRRDPEGARFLERFLALFELVFTGVEDRYEEFSRELNPDAAPLEIIDWLACLVDLAFDPSWPLDRRRELVGSAMELYRERGTVEGIRRYVEIYTGQRPTILEAFLRRPGAPAFLGRPGAVLGCAFPLSGRRPETPPREDLYRDYAHRFTVVAYLPDECDRETLEPVLNRIVEANRPAHTEHAVCIVRPEARLELQSTVGVDFMLGDRAEPDAQVGGCPTPRGKPVPATLGVDSVLSERRPQYARRHELRL